LTIAEFPAAASLPSSAAAHRLDDVAIHVEGERLVPELVGASGRV
jgi:hypothetical protein